MPTGAGIIPVAMENVYRRMVLVSLFFLVLTWGAWLVHTNSTDVQGRRVCARPHPKATWNVKTVCSSNSPVAVKRERPTALVLDALVVAQYRTSFRPW